MTENKGDKGDGNRRGSEERDKGKDRHIQESEYGIYKKKHAPPQQQAPRPEPKGGGSRGDQSSD